MGWVETSEKKIEPLGCSVGRACRQSQCLGIGCAIAGEKCTYLFAPESPLCSIPGVRLSNHQSLVGSTVRGVIKLIS
jgi:hypothetical protein